VIFWLGYLFSFSFWLIFRLEEVVCLHSLYTILWDIHTIKQDHRCANNICILYTNISFIDAYIYFYFTPIHKNSVQSTRYLYSISYSVRGREICIHLLGQVSGKASMLSSFTVFWFSSKPVTNWSLKIVECSHFLHITIIMPMYFSIYKSGAAISLL